jgi:hypothetical protein
MPKGIHNSRRGPKTQFHPTFVTTAYEQCLLGQSEDEIAELFGVSQQTLIKWKRQHPTFAKAFQRGGSLADGKVAKALLKRAIGFSHSTEKRTYDAEGNVTQRIRSTTHYPPEPAALSFYLFNRSRAKWSSKPAADLSINLGLESLIAEVVKARDERAAKLVIEHKPDEGEPGSS